MFLRIDYNIIDAVFREQGGGVGRASVNLLNIGFALAKIQSVGPDMPRIAHQRTSSGQKYRRIMNWRVQDGGPRRRLLLDHLGKVHAVAIELLVFALSRHQGKDIQAAGEN